MPRFAANLAYLFTERPLIERFAAAAAAGLKAVELQLPYDLAPAVVKAELDRHGLTVLGLNTASGRLKAGEFGIAAVPGCEQEFAAVFKQALDYITAIGGCQIHCLAGKVAPEQRPAADKIFVSNLARAADAAADKGITLLIEPINPRDRPDYFLTRRARRGCHRQARPQERPHPVRLLSCADRRRRSDQALRAALPGGRPRADRGGALAPRARRGRDQLYRDLHCARPHRLWRLDRLRVSPARADRGRPGLGAWVWDRAAQLMAVVTKRAVNLLSKSMAAELAGDGIWVGAIAPAGGAGYVAHCRRIITAKPETPR
jgi:NAD(P)-dependent dehydrogenase (short-subunit alcohol dehydrogenase family)